jgi:hypothetical protein
MKTRILTTIEEVREVFQTQIDNAIPCSGDYLNGKSYEEVKQGLIDVGCWPEGVDAFLKSRIQMWQEHKGELMLFVMFRLVRDGERIAEVQRMWESEFPRFIGKKFDYGTPSGIPIFVEQEWLDAAGIK